MRIVEGRERAQCLNHAAHRDQRCLNVRTCPRIGIAQRFVHRFLASAIARKLRMIAVQFIRPGLLDHQLCPGCPAAHIPGKLHQIRLIGLVLPAVMACLLQRDHIPVIRFQHLPDGDRPVVRHRRTVLFQRVRFLFRQCVFPVQLQRTPADIQIGAFQDVPFLNTHVVQIVVGILRETVADGQNFHRLILHPFLWSAEGGR